MKLVTKLEKSTVLYMNRGRDEQRVASSITKQLTSRKQCKALVYNEIVRKQYTYSN